MARLGGASGRLRDVPMRAGESRRIAGSRDPCRSGNEFAGLSRHHGRGLLSAQCAFSTPDTACRSDRAARCHTSCSPVRRSISISASVALMTPSRPKNIGRLVGDVIEPRPDGRRRRRPASPRRHSLPDRPGPAAAPRAGRGSATSISHAIAASIAQSSRRQASRSSSGSVTMAAVSRPLIDGCSYVRALAAASVVVVVLLAPAGQPAVHADLRRRTIARPALTACRRSGAQRVVQAVERRAPVATSPSSVSTLTIALSLNVMCRE